MKHLKKVNSCLLNNTSALAIKRWNRNVHKIFVAAWQLTSKWYSVFPEKTVALKRINPFGITLQFSSVAQSCSTLCDPMDCSTPGLPVHHQLPEFTQTHVHQVGDVIQQSHPLSSLLLLPSILPSIRVFSNESVLRIRWPNYWSFSFSISPSNEYSELISFRMDWVDLLQHYSSKASILWCSAFFIVQLSHPYMTTGKTIDLTRWTFVGKVMSLLFKMLSRLVIAFLPRSVF